MSDQFTTEQQQTDLKVQKEQPSQDQHQIIEKVEQQSIETSIPIKPQDKNYEQLEQKENFTNKFSQITNAINTQVSKGTIFGLRFDLDRLNGFLGMQKNVANQDMFFTLSQQRKEQSLIALKDWANENTDIFEKNREILEELIGGVDQRCRLSVDFLQICYRFFSEKCTHEAKYSKLLLTKPSPHIIQNFMGMSLYQQVGNYICEFDEINIKQQERAAIFASSIESQILNGSIFQEFAMLDQIMDQSLSALIIQKKLLQQLLVSASIKLNKMIPLFAVEGNTKVPQQQQPQVQQERQRKNIFDNKDDKKQGIQNFVVSGLSNIGQMLLSPLQGTTAVDPFYVPKNTVDEQQKVSDSKSPEVKLSEQNNLSIPSSSLDEAKTQTNTKSQEIPKDNIGLLLQQKQNVQQPQASNKGDLFKIMQSFIRTQEQANNTYNLCIEKFLIYWDHIIHVEQKRSQWVRESCTLYNKLYNETYKILPIQELKFQTELEVEATYSIDNVLPLEFSRQIKQYYPNLSRDNIKELLTIKQVPCQAAKILVVKEFKLNRHLPNKPDIHSTLILSIDKYLSCWDSMDQKQIDNTEKPVFHAQLSELQINIVSQLEVDIMPSRHLLFMNIGNEKQKTTLKFNCTDDLEEFITIIEMQKN